MNEALKWKLWNLIADALDEGRGRLDSDDWLEDDVRDYKELFDQLLPEITRGLN